MVDIEDWSGLVSARRASSADLVLVAPLNPSRAGGSGAFQGRADDGCHYWLKTLNNGQTPKVPAAEQIVARAGGLIGAPTCTVKTIEIPEALAGWEFRPGRQIEAGIAHASREISACAETRSLSHRQEDDNAARHAFVFGLWDWCWGADHQWLMALQNEHRFYSHDHGHYLPGGPNWSRTAILGAVDDAHELPLPHADVEPEAVDACIEALTQASRADILDVVAAVPKSWPVTDEDLEAAGFLLERRAGPAAERLAARFGRQ